jgi:hypothetical protein
VTDDEIVALGSFCTEAHLVNPKTREAPGAQDEKTRGALRAHTTRINGSYGAVALNLQALF